LLATSNESWRPAFRAAILFGSGVAIQSASPGLFEGRRET
jgi:hypothetical protein